MEKYTNEYLLNFYAKGFVKIPKELIDEKELKAIKLIKEVTKKYNNIVLGYSLGKDSIVVDYLLSKANVKYKQVLFRTYYHFTEIKQWWEKNKRENSLLIEIPRPTWEDLEKNSDLLFSINKKADTEWMLYKYKIQQKYLKQNCDLFITGRRYAERNRCGAKADNFIVKGTYDTFSPIADWTTEDVIAYLRYNDIELPPNYLKYKNGFAYGSIAWAERQRFNQFNNDINEKWQEVYDIEKEIVIEASKHLSSAKKWLEERENKK